MGRAETSDRYEFTFLLMLGAYCFLNLMVRMAISPAVAFDEAEMVLSSQTLAWGYGLQPPLYVWLQKAVVGLFGFQVFSLALLKSVLLFALYLFVYLAAREVFGRVCPALFTVACLFFIPAFVWEGVRSQTHNVLATAIAAAFLYTLLKLLGRPWLPTYLLLGVLAGLGMLGKYNFVVLLVASGVSLVAVREGRQILIDWRTILSFLSFLLILTPHLSWLGKNSELLREYSSKLGTSEVVASTWNSYSAGLVELALALVFFLGMVSLALTLQFGLKWMKPSMKRREASPVATSFLRRLFFSSVAILILIVLLSGATEFRDRWLEPILFFSPILFVAGVSGSITKRQGCRFVVLGWILAFTALSVLYGRILFPDATGRILPLNYPSREFAQKLSHQGFERGVLITSTQEIAGSLKLFFPESTIVTPDYPLPLRAAGDPEVILVCWNPEETEAVPVEVAELLRDRFGIESGDLAKPTTLNATYLYSKNLSAQLTFVLISLENGESRVVPRSTHLTFKRQFSLP